MALSLSMGMPTRTRALSATAKAISNGLTALRKYGANAHLWLPGVGYFNGVDLGNYLDSAGTSPGTVDNPIGLVLDIANATTGPNLVSNGDLTTDISGWTSVNSPITSNGTGGVTIQKNGSSDGQLTQAVTTVVGQSYKISCFVTNPTNNYIFGVTGTNTGYQAVPGRITLYFTASSTSTTVILQQGGSSGATTTFGQVSLQAISGIPASQATTANKPTLRRGMTNLQVYSSVSSGIANSTYAGGSTGTGITPAITPNYDLDPWGGSTACRVQLSLNGGATTADRAYLSATAASLDNSPRTSLTWVKSLAGPTTLLTRYNGNTAYYTIGSDWQLISTVGNSTTDPTHNVVEIRGGQSTTNSNTADLLVATHGVFLGSVTPQQVLQCGGIPLTTVSPVSSAAGNWCWQGNGSSTSLQKLASVTSSDDFVAVAGAQLNAATGGGYYVIAQPAGNTGTSARLCTLAIGPSNVLQAHWANDAGGSGVSSPGSATVGVPFVFSGQVKASALRSRVNGGAWGNSTTATGVFTLNTSAIGFAYGFNAWAGQQFPYVEVKGTVSDSDLLAIERFIAVFTGPTGVSF